MKQKLAELKHTRGPSMSTRSKTTAASAPTTPSSRRINNVNISNDTGNKVILSSGNVHVEATGRFDHGSDDSLVSASLAERAIRSNIGKITCIPQTTLRMPINSNNNSTNTFVCNRVWTAPRTTFQVPSGNLALQNIAYLVIDGELLTEDLPVGRPILEHLSIDTNTLINSNYDRTNNTDCVTVNSPLSSTSTIRRIESTSTTNSNHKHKNNSVDYHQGRYESDMIYDPSLLDTPAIRPTKEDALAVANLLKTCHANGLAEQPLQRLTTTMNDHQDIFRSQLKVSPPAKIPPLRIDLTPDARPKKVRLRNFSQEQPSISGFIRYSADRSKHGLLQPFILLGISSTHCIQAEIEQTPIHRGLATSKLLHCEAQISNAQH